MGLVSVVNTSAKNRILVFSIYSHRTERLGVENNNFFIVAHISTLLCLDQESYNIRLTT